MVFPSFSPHLLSPPSHTFSLPLRANQSTRAPPYAALPQHLARPDVPPSLGHRSPASLPRSSTHPANTPWSRIGCFFGRFPPPTFANFQQIFKWKVRLLPTVLSPWVRFWSLFLKKTRGFVGYSKTPLSRCFPTKFWPPPVSADQIEGIFLTFVLWVLIWRIAC